jgi:glutathione synthase/RimK-type ligase-like ATP-grasp enzyme
VVSWDDPTVDWTAFDVAVIRSTWDYHRRFDEFMAWVRSTAASTRLLNPLAILEWNTDKRYLSDLESAGFPVVPTRFVPPGHDAMADVRRLLEHGDIVVKPSISAGSNDTERHDSFDEATKQIEGLHAAGRTVMVQPYVERVDVEGETGLVFMNGEYSHAFAKGAMLASSKTMAGGLYAEERIEARLASDAQRRLGDDLVRWVTERFGLPLYARVDLLPTADGPIIIELEMTEPSLYVSLGDGAADRFARAVLSR